MRADFYGKCAENPVLAAALSDHQALVGEMTEDELRLAIERPAELMGCEFEPGLVHVLLQEMKGQAGSLPLLQYALQELWRQRQGHRLTHVAYSEIGRIEGALEIRAETVFNEQLTEAEKWICRQVFVRLTQAREHAEATKRRILMQELKPAQGDLEEIESVVQKLSDEDTRLITVKGKSESAEERIVEIGHEALIRGWRRLKSWLDEDQEFLLWRQRLQTLETEWKQKNYDDNFLLRGGLLAEAERWLNERSGELNNDEQHFIRESAKFKDDQEKKEKERQQRELKQAQILAAEKQRRAEAARQLAAERTEAAKRLKKRAWLASSLGLVALILAGVALVFFFKEQTARERAEINARRVLQQFDRKRVENLKSVTGDLYASSPRRIPEMKDWLKDVEKLSRRMEDNKRAHKELKKVDSSTLSGSQRSEHDFELNVLAELITGLDQLQRLVPRVKMRLEAIGKLKDLKYEPLSGPIMGSIVEPDGIRFRVWAPHAESVAVKGDFNGWSDSANPLVKEGRGYWSVNVPDAKPGNEYSYVITNSGTKLYRNDPYARDVTSSNGKSVIYDPYFQWRTKHFQSPPLNEMVIYELHVGTFNDQPGGAPGELAGVVEKLPYLKNLGVNAIQLMPVAEFPGAYSWGYNPSQLFSVESAYGGPAALKDLVDKAHGYGIAVILDVEYNHLGPNDLDLWQFDGWNKDGKGGIYFYNDWRSRTPWGDTRPDYGRSEVRLFLRDNAVMWLDEFKADGLRWDMTLFIRTSGGNQHDPGQSIGDGWTLMQWINDEAKNLTPSKIMIADDFSDNGWLTADTSEGGAGFDSKWDTTFSSGVRKVLVPQDDDQRDIDMLRDALVNYEEMDPFQRIIYTEAHDEVANGRARVPQDIWPGNAGSWASRKRSTLGAVLVFTSPGIPMIFQGQEILEDEWFRDTDPIDWSKKDTYRGIYHLYRDLIRLRRNLDGNTSGLQGKYFRVLHNNNLQKLLVFHRWSDNGGPGDSVVVVMNLSAIPQKDYPIKFPRGGRWTVRFDSVSAHYGFQSSEYSEIVTADLTRTDEMIREEILGKVTIAPYSAMILSQDE